MGAPKRTLKDNNNARKDTNGWMMTVLERMLKDDDMGC